MVVLALRLSRVAAFALSWLATLAALGAWGTGLFGQWGDYTGVFIAAVLGTAYAIAAWTLLVAALQKHDSATSPT